MGRERTAAVEESRPWPTWARRLVTAALLYHLTALLAGALAFSPSSELERAVADRFVPYYELLDQGAGYRYYAPEPPPTPVVTARLQFADGRPEATIRLPDRSVWPRLRFQRQLALAKHLADDAEEAQGAPHGPEGPPKSLWATSYARHLCKTRGASKVELFVQMHRQPESDRVREALARPGRSRLDLEAEEFYTVPERIGEFACDAF